MYIKNIRQIIPPEIPQINILRGVKESKKGIKYKISEEKGFNPTKRLAVSKERERGE